MLPNELFALACRAYYDEQGFIIDASNGEFAHSPLTRKECDTGYYLLHGHHQHQGLLQSKDLNKCCFFAYDTLKWLRECDYFPENYFELWGIYEKYASEHSSKNGKTTHEKKDDLGRSVNGVKNAERLHKEKDDLGRSVNSVKGAIKATSIIHSDKNRDGKSLHAIKMGKKGGIKGGIAVHSEKNEFGRSLHAVKNLEKVHKEKDQYGRSVNAVRAAEKTHEIKDEFGRSVRGVRQAERLNKEKDEFGRSLNGVRLGEQIWESKIDGFRSNSAGVARHNKARGWDPAAKVKIS